jgi:hypothetical protein
MRQALGLLLVLWAGAARAATPGTKAAPDVRIPAEVRVLAPSWQAAAQPGDWVQVRTRLSLGAGRELETSQRITVTSVARGPEELVVTAVHETESGGNKERITQLYRLPVTGPPAPGPAGREVGQEGLTIAGKRVSCMVRERAEPDGANKLTVKTWSSDSVPLGGMVRIEQNGKRVYELLDFGREKAP